MRFRRTILAEHDLSYLLEVADQLFRGNMLEEKVFAVLMLQGIVGEFGKREFKLFEGWLDRISSWADHDGLVQYLIGPILAADATLLSRPPRWAKSKKRWHRRAAAVSLIHCTRQHKNFADIQRITEMLLGDDDDMVQKGLGWLLREAAKVQSEADGRVSDDDSRALAEAGAAHGVRNAAGGDAGAGASEGESVESPLRHCGSAEPQIPPLGLKSSVGKTIISREQRPEVLISIAGIGSFGYAAKVGRSG